MLALPSANARAFNRPQKGLTMACLPLRNVCTEVQDGSDLDHIAPNYVQSP